MRVERERKDEEWGVISRDHLHARLAGFFLIALKRRPIVLNPRLSSGSGVIKPEPKDIENRQEREGMYDRFFLARKPGPRSLDRPSIPVPVHWSDWTPSLLLSIHAAVTRILCS